MRALKMLCCAAALVAFMAPPAHADEWNKLTFFTFSGPVQIPNATLPAGTYTFKLADVYGNRHIVEIYNKDQTKLITTLMAVPNDRGENNEADKPIVMFSETPAGQPAAVKAWFYPGMRIGDEFVYPKTQAMKIAKAYHQPVLATDSDMANAKASDKSAWEKADVGHMDENGRMVEEKNASNANSADQNTNASQNARANAAPPATATTGATAKSAPAQVGTTARNNSAADNARMNRRNRANRSNANAVGTSGQNSAAQNDNANANRRRHLPKTASPLGLVALLSGLSLAGGLGVRRARARLAESR